MAIDWTVFGTALGSLIIGVGSYFGGRKTRKAKSSAEYAEYGAERSMSNAETALYEQLRGRLTDLEGDIRNLRSELEIERGKARDLESHIWKLEKLMKDAGIEVPVFVRYYQTLTLKDH